MTSRLRLTVALVLWFALLGSAQAQGVSVYGTVTNAFGQPVPGITVSLFHPQFGRSFPAYTDGFGRYTMYAVPVHPTPYYIEAYWGNQLIYRAPISVAGPVMWHIRLN
jgi:hypothetical protein